MLTREPLTPPGTVSLGNRKRSGFAAASIFCLCVLTLGGWSTRAEAAQALDSAALELDFRSTDVDALEKYDAAVKFDKGHASAEDKAKGWRRLAEVAPKFASVAEKRAAEWERLAGARRTAAEAPAARLPVGQVSGSSPAPTRVTAGKAGVEWVSIPGGTFLMGSDPGDVHKVGIRAFQMAKTLVTNKQYQACVEAGACTMPLNYGNGFNCEDQPVVGVNWSQAKAFSKWAGGRLPSEAEWEYAARSAGKDQRYPWGSENTTCDKAVIEGCAGATMPVCSRPAGNTMQGLCDMAGNAWEWVEDWYHLSYRGSPGDGSAWEHPPEEGSLRVLRGGSWDDAAPSASATYRYYVRPNYGDNRISFRPVR